MDSRKGPGQTTKLGRLSRRGKRQGYRCNADMQQTLLEGFIRHKSLAKTQGKIYREVLTDNFGCVSITKRASPSSSDTLKENLFRPSPVSPWISKLISPKELAIALKGAHGVGAQSGSEGSFADSVINVNQRVEFDGYYISEKISGLTEGSAVDSFCVVRAVRSWSGMVWALASAAKHGGLSHILHVWRDKVQFCEQFGIEISADEMATSGCLAGWYWTEVPP